MKWLKENWFVLLLIAIIVLLVYFFACSKSTSPHTDNKREKDSLIAVIKDMEFKNSDVNDSLKESNINLTAKVGAQQTSLNNLKVSLSNTLSKLQKYQVAIIKKVDTADVLANCDSLSNQFADYAAMCVEEGMLSDSMIENLNHIIVNKDSAIAVKDRSYITLKTSFETVNKNYDALYKDYGKAIKKSKFHKFLDKSMVVVIAGLTIGLLVK